MIFVDGEEVPEREDLSLYSKRIVTFSSVSPALKLLRLSLNQLTSFEGNFPNLECLDLFNNQLTSFEGDFPKLKWLRLIKNRLTSFEGNFPKLKHLWLDDNELTSFEGNFPKLERLGLSRNQRLKTMGVSLETTPNLSEIYLEDTNVKFVDPFIVHLVKYKKVSPRSHFLGLIALLEPFFPPHGNPVFEEVIEHIEE